MKKLFLFAAFTLLFSCSSDDTTTNTTDNTNEQPSMNDEIFLGGSYGNKAAYWINNQVFTPYGINSKINEVTLHNGKLTGCGEQLNEARSVNEGVYFQNATVTSIQPYILTTVSNNTEHSYAKAMFSDGTDYYIAGNDGNRISFWKNGYLKTNLTDNSTSGYAKGIFVSGNKLYMVGWQGNTPKAMLWEYDLVTNAPSLRTNLTGGATGIANSVFVSGTDVYVGGWRNHNATYWKNGVETNLSNLSGADGVDKKAYINKIIVVDNVVYAVGLIKETASSSFEACLWKNGVMTKLSKSGTGDSEAFDIKVKGNNVYIVGDETVSHGRIGKLWKNGVATNYEVAGSEISLRSIVVK